jgi:hypothetical protein
MGQDRGAPGDELRGSRRRLLFAKAKSALVVGAGAFPDLAGGKARARTRKKMQALIEGMEDLPTEKAS